MKKSTPFFYLLVFIALGCSEKIVHYVNESSTFDKYDSFITVNYKVNETDLSPEGKQIFHDIASLINDQMSQRGYDVNHVDPDLIVRYELISNQVTEVSMNNSYYYSPIPRPYITARTFLESALLIEATDSSTKKLVWQASVDLKRYSKRDNTEAILQEAIQQLFNTYPYRAESNVPDESLIK